MGGRIVVAGASMAGLRAAEQLRAAGWSGAITLVGDEPHMPYNRPPLSKEVLAGKAPFEALAFTPKAVTADVEWRLGTKVVAARLAERTVETDDEPRAHLHRALHWHRYSRGPVNSLHRRCGADICRGSLRLLRRVESR